MATIDWGFRTKALRRFFDFEPNRPNWLLMSRIPLLVWLPGPDAPAGKIDLTAGLSDLPVTLLALLGIDPATYPFMGRNLLGTPSPHCRAAKARRLGRSDLLLRKRTSNLFRARCSLPKESSLSAKPASSRVSNSGSSPDMFSTTTFRFRCERYSRNGFPSASFAETDRPSGDR